LSPAKLTFASNSAPVAFNKRISGGHRVLRCDGQQCRLADACLTGEQHRPAFADGSLDERGEPLDVYLSSDELALITTFHRRLLRPSPGCPGPSTSLRRVAVGCLCSDELSRMTEASRATGILRSSSTLKPIGACSCHRSLDCPRPRVASSAASAQLFMAKRADARITEVSSSHVAMYSHPGRVVDIILDAAESVS
jgi:hypothetical protein